jgi:Cu-processing system permease protein
MMLNPADIFRLINLAGLDSSDVNGALSVAINASLPQSQLILMLSAWVILPLSLAIFIFKKKTL